MTWVTPREWTLKEPITASKLNEFSAADLYLFSRPKSVVTIPGDGTNITTTSTTFTAVDDAQFTLSLEVAEGAEVQFDLLASCRHSVLGGFFHFDIIMDDVTYMSSMTGTPVTDGIWKNQARAASVDGALGAAPFYRSGIAAGVHTFKLRWRLTTAGLITLMINGTLAQFAARER